MPTHPLLGEQHPIRPEIGAKASASHGRPSTSSRRCFQEASRADVPTEKRWKTTSASAMIRSTKKRHDIGINTSTTVIDEVCAATTVRSMLQATFNSSTQLDLIPKYHAHPPSPSKQFLYALAVFSQSSDPSPVDMPFPRPFFKKQLPGHLLNTQSRLA
jgi:hypothetical protein